MTEQIIGYKGNKQTLSASEQEEFDALTQITKQLSADLVGQQLIDWYAKLTDKIGMDSGMFYCPYIPLMSTAVIDKNSNNIAFKTRYGVVCQM